VGGSWILLGTSGYLLHKLAKSEASTERSAWLSHFVLATEYKLCKTPNNIAKKIYFPL